MSFFKKLLGKFPRQEKLPKTDSSALSESRESAEASSHLAPVPGSKETLLRQSKPEPEPIQKTPAKAWIAKKLPEWQVGDVILDHYEIRDVITTGGMGRIYVAWHQNWKVPIAIKAPTEEMLADTGYFARVQREAEAWTELGLHPNIAYCYFVRNLEEVPHLFVEYVDGGNLRDWIRDGRCADLKVGLDLAIQFCHGMAHAHAKGLIHRDIKPENILMTNDGVLKVTDFGIARWGPDEQQVGLALARGEEDSQTIGFIGTKAYASPEQWRDAHNVGPETDVFSFGICLWEMFCGRRPYSVAAAKERIPDPQSLRAGLPEGLYTLLTDVVAFEIETRQHLGGFESLRESFKALYQELFNEPSLYSELDLLDLVADGLNNQGVSFFEMGKKEAATMSWKEALCKDPHHFEATFNLGYLQWQDGEITDSFLLSQIKQLEQPRREVPNYWRCLAWIHLERGDINAVEHIQRSKHCITDPDFLKAYEDPEKPMVRLIQNFEGHNSRNVDSVSFSPDGKYALSGGLDFLRLWDIKTGKEMRSFFIGHDDGRKICYSPDGRFALSGSWDETIRLWDINSGREIRRFDNNTRVNSLCFSPDGRFGLSGGWDNTLRLWDIESGKEVRRFQGHKDQVKCVCFSYSGKYALSGSDDHTIRLWEVNTGKELHRFDGHSGIVYCASFSPDDRNFVSAGLDGTLRLWNFESGNEIKRFETNTKKSVMSVCFSPEGDYLLSRELMTATFILWNIVSGRAVFTFEGHIRAVNSVSFSPDGRYILSGSEDKTIRLWEIFLPKNWPVYTSAHPILSPVKTVTLISAEFKSARALIATAKEAINEGGFLEAYGLIRQAQSIPGYARDPNVMNLLNICTTKKAKSRICGFKDGWYSRRLEGELRSICFSPDYVIGLSGRSLTYWDIKTLEKSWSAEFKHVNVVSISPCYRYLLIGGNYTFIRLFKSGQQIQLLNVRPGDIHHFSCCCACFSPDSQYIIWGNSYGDIILWETETGRELKRIRGHTSIVKGDGCVVKFVSFSQDGKYVISGGEDKIIRLWDIQLEKELMHYKGHTGSIVAGGFCDDNRYAFSCGNGDFTVRIWEVGSGKELQCHKGLANCVSLVPGGKYGLSVAHDVSRKDLVLWEIMSNREIYRFKGHTNNVTSVCFFPDGRYALSGSSDGTTRLWEFDWEWEFPDSDE